MRRSTRMLLMNGTKHERRNDDRDRMYDDYRQRDREYEEYQPQNRFRDRRGREHYDDGRYAPMNTYGGHDPMYQDYRTPYVPPVYVILDAQDRSQSYRPMSKIGFALEGEMDHIPHDYRTNRYTYTIDEKTGDWESRHGYTDEPMPFTHEMALGWTGDMQNADGSRGPHWNMEQVRQVMDQRDIKCDPLQFFAVLNAVYSDYCSVAKRHGVNKMDFYADLAKAWLDDADAKDDKAARYFCYIVKH